MNLIDKETVIVVDTSILNHIIYKNMSIGSKVLDLLIKYKKNIWIPFTVYEEFLKVNADKFVDDKVKSFKKIKSDFTKIHSELENKLKGTFIEINKQDYIHWKNAEKGINLILKQIPEIIQNYGNDGDVNDYKESIYKYYEKVKNFVDDLKINGQVGSDFSTLEILDICEEGKRRYENLIPPGYSDINKKGKSKYNDLFIWKEILKHFKKYEKITEIIFLTEDIKDGNWWNPFIDNKEKRVMHDFLKKEFEELYCDYSEKSYTSIKFMTLEYFWEFCGDELDIQTYISLDEEELIDSLMNKYSFAISEELCSYVTNIPPEDIDEEFYRNNDGEIFYEDLRLLNYQVEITDEGTIEYALSVELDFSMTFAYEDNEGDCFRLGEAELLTSAIILITEEYIKNQESNCYRLISQRKVRTSDFRIENFTYQITTSTNLYDE